MKYRLSEELGKVNTDFIEEVFEYSERIQSEGRSIIMKKRKILQIAVAAAVLATLCGITVFAVRMGGLMKMRDYVREKNEQQNVPEILRDENVEEKGTDLVPEGAPALRPGEARISSILAGKTGFIITYEVNVNGTDIAENVSDYSKGWFRWNGMETYGITPEGEKIKDFASSITGPEFISDDGGVLTFVFNGSVTSEAGIPDHIGFEFSGLTFTDLNNAETAGEAKEYTVDLPVKIDVKKEDYTVLESISCVEPKEIFGHEFTVTMDGCGIILSGGDMTVDEHNEIVYKIYNECDVIFTLNDGTVVTDTPYPDFATLDIEEYYSREHIINAGSGTFRNGICYNFATLYDVTQIKSIEIGGAVFTF